MTKKKTNMAIVNMDFASLYPSITALDVDKLRQELRDEKIKDLLDEDSDENGNEKEKENE